MIVAIGVCIKLCAVLKTVYIVLIRFVVGSVAFQTQK